jgi:poly(3-hydroxybutyrate) depolymerase
MVHMEHSMFFTRLPITRCEFVFLVSCMFVSARAELIPTTLAGRGAMVYVPSKLPPTGDRALLVVLHGGLGNAERIAKGHGERAINFNALADAHGFVVAYLNGTPVARLLRDDRRGWNAGNCCGLPAEKRVDDVSYVQAAVQVLFAAYGIGAGRVFGVGHSNGAMMTQRILCESVVYASAVSLSGTLENNAAGCPLAKGKRLLALHGADDLNVPVAGGIGSKGMSRVAFASQVATAKVWQDSGAEYLLQIVPGADHSVDAISAQLQRLEGQSLGLKVVRFLGLDTR